MVGIRWLIPLAHILSFVCLYWPVHGAAWEINEPIGIDFGPHFVLASYANSPTNFTLLAAVDDDEYRLRLMQLWVEAFEQRDLRKLYGHPPASSASWTKRLSALAARVPILKEVIGLISPKTWHRTNLAEVTETVSRICTEIKAVAEKDHDIDIRFAISSVPDFLNETINEVIVEACEQGGIEGPQPKRALPRLYASHFLHPEIPPDSSVLAIHQGQFYGGIQLFSHMQKAGQQKGKVGTYIPLDPWSSRNIQRQLVAELRESNPSLETQIFLGADEDFLMSETQRARMTLKNKDPAVEILGLDDDNDESGSSDLDELPLDLNSWWKDGNYPEGGIKLTRQQVRAKDDHFVETLAGSIVGYLEFIQETFDTQQPVKIDYALIVTDYVDGDLVRRAIKEVLGDGVKILGGSLQNVTMVADSVARMTYQRRQNLIRTREMRGYRDEL